MSRSDVLVLMCKTARSLMLHTGCWWSKIVSKRYTLGVVGFGTEGRPSLFDDDWALP